MTARRVTAALVIVLLGQAVAYGALLGHVEHGSGRPNATMLVAVTVPLWAAAVALTARLRLAPRHAGAFVLGAGAVLSIVAMTHRPATSDDDFRYAWDGRVQLAGVDPYRYPPAATELARLRDPFLFGGPGAHRHPIGKGVTTAVNRPDVRTVYPPVAEAAFTALRVLSFGGHGNHLPLQLAAALGALAVGAILLRRGPPWRAALWTWCPVTVVEFANNAHVDWLGVLLAVLALTVARRTWLVGVLVGAATAVKLYPALVLPALLRRDWRIGLVAVGFVALVYVPHVLAVGLDVIGYLPGYLQENQYGDGGRLLLLSPLLGDTLGTLVGVVVLAAVSVWAWRRGDPARPERAAVVVVGVAFLVVTPNYGWYAALLLALVALTGALEWLPIVFAATLAYVVPGDHDTLIYAVALAAAGAGRVMRARRPDLTAPLGSPSR
ncbi:glycosyltransferase family 87 protein [Jatrophihabitans endophyticus]|uniref:glycosyltransferase family 87 protein n=1 Tax=Jatrophihabitans endophyticus TaxID=1206085 RepID=UPI0011613471|nr:glycosyltransferase family 87 protein [Jatrophihabitans endophyticus]